MPRILIDCGARVVKVKPIGFGGVEAILNGETMAGLRQTGTIRGGDGLGFIRLGHSSLGASAFIGGVYQRRVTGYNNTGRKVHLPRKTYYVKMRYYRPTNPNSSAQQAGRSKFADAVAGWAALTAAEKEEYNKRAHKLSRRGRNLYISEYMR